MMSDPTPVPLDDIDIERFQACGITPSEIRALCDALRIAVEGLDEIDPACIYQRWDPVAKASVGDRCDDCAGCRSASALAAVRELVDLGGDDG